MRSTRHTRWYLILAGKFAFGDHVSDPAAFVARARKALLSRRTYDADGRRVREVET